MDKYEIDEYIIRYIEKCQNDQVFFDDQSNIFNLLQWIRVDEKTNDLYQYALERASSKTLTELAEFYRVHCDDKFYEKLIEKYYCLAIEKCDPLEKPKKMFDLFHFNIRRIRYFNYVSNKIIKNYLQQKDNKNISEQNKNISSKQNNNQESDDYCYCIDDHVECHESNDSEDENDYEDEYIHTYSEMHKMVKIIYKKINLKIKNNMLKKKIKQLEKKIKI